MIALHLVLGRVFTVASMALSLGMGAQALGSGALQSNSAAAERGAPSPDAFAGAYMEQPQTDALGVGEIQVRFGQTLWSIALAAKPPSYEKVQQYMFAILAENPGSFNGGNINGLFAGSRLRLPSAASAAAFPISPQEAIRRAEAQNAAWLSGAAAGELSILIEEGDQMVARASEADAAAAPAPARPRGAERTAAAAQPPASAPVALRPDEDAPLPAEASAPMPLAEDALADLSRQVQRQLRRLEVQDGAIARLAADLSALRARQRSDRKAWMAEAILWRRVAVGVAVAALALLGAAAWGMRRRRSARAADGGGAAAARDLPRRRPPAVSASAIDADSAGAAKDLPHGGPNAPRAPSDAAPSEGGDSTPTSDNRPPDDAVSAAMEDQHVKLNLARANIRLGKLDVAREILEEVLAQGPESAQQEARTLLNDIPDQKNQPPKG